MALRRHRDSDALLTTRRTIERLEARARYSAPPDVVWQVLWSPDTAVRIWPETYSHSAVLPGTGPGTGEIHVQVTRDPIAVQGLVIREMRVPEYVRYTSLDADQSITEITLTADFGATQVHWATTFDWPVGTRLDRIEATAVAVRTFIETYLRGSGRIIDVPVELDGPWRTS